MNQQVTPYKETDRSKKAQVEEMFDNIAHRYDLLNHLLSMGIDKIWRKKAIKYLKNYQPKVIMDMATGTGDFAFEALKLKPEVVKAVDISQAMLDVGNQKSIKRSVSDIVHFEKGDSENLAYEDNTFDAITVGFGVRNYENLKLGLTEMRRTLKPNGKLVILEISKPSKFPLKQFYQFYFNYVCPLIGRVISGDKRAYSYLPESVNAFPEGTAFLKILEETGYKNSQWLPLTFGICAMYTCEK